MDAGRLQALVNEEFRHEQIILLTNREPFRHEAATVAREARTSWQSAVAFG